MNGKSVLILGEGRSGKSGFCGDVISGQAPVPPFIPLNVDPEQKWIIFSPSKTIGFMYELDYVNDEEPSEGSDDKTLKDKILRAYSESSGHLLVLIKKDNPNLFPTLGEEDEEGNAPFFGFNFYFDEIGIILQDAKMKQGFKEFIRGVGQKNQTVLMSTHRLTGDLPPVAGMNVNYIFFIGPTVNSDEITNLIGVSNVVQPRKDLEEKLANSPKYDWWAKRNPEAITPIKI